MNKQMSFDSNNVASIDSFLAENASNSQFLQENYRMIKNSSYHPVEISLESRKKCVKSLIQ